MAVYLSAICICLEWACVGTWVLGVLAHRCVGMWHSACMDATVRAWRREDNPQRVPSHCVAPEVDQSEFCNRHLSPLSCLDSTLFLWAI